MRKIKGLSKFKEYLWPSVMEGGVTPSPVDKSQLISTIEYWDTSSSEYPPENYTPESYQAVLNAYSVAVAVRDNEEATQEEVDDAYFGLLNAISSLEEVPSGDVCKYPLDKTDFSELDSSLGKPAGFIQRPVVLDSSQQYFELTDRMVEVFAPKELIMDFQEGIQLTAPVTGNINAGFSFGIEIDFSNKAVGDTPVSFEFYFLPFKDGTALLTGGEFNQNYFSISGFDYHPQTDKYTAVCVISSEGILVNAFDSDGAAIGSNFYESGYGFFEEYDDFALIGLVNQFNEEENPEGSVFEGTRIRLISDKEELSDLISKVDYSEVPDVITTLCGQPLDLSPIEPEGTKGLDGELVGG